MKMKIMIAMMSVYSRGDHIKSNSTSATYVHF